MAKDSAVRGADDENGTSSADPRIQPAIHHHVVDAGQVKSCRPDELWREALRCRRCARAIAMMLLDAPGWVNRRVERVRFHDNRTAERLVTMDYSIPCHAPRYVTEHGRALRLLPLTLMRRKTLVNFGIEDSHGQPLSLMGMRHAQALTEQLILVLAEITPKVDPDSPHVKRLAEQVAFGTQQEMLAAVTAARKGDSGRDAKALLRDPAAGHLIRRLSNNFILLVTIDDEGPARRILKFRYDEPLSLSYKRSGYSSKQKAYDAQAQRVGKLSPARLAPGLGWKATAIRFPIPSAELTRSFHFEVEAPPGVTIAQAALVAGRPNESNERPSWDHVAGGFPVVGLHAYDVPYGSMSRAQVQLRANRRGWLTSSLIASVLSTVLLWLSALWLDAEKQNVSAALLAVTAAFVAYVIKPAEHEMVSRLITGVRYAATISVLLLVGAGALQVALGADATVYEVVAASAGSCCTVLMWLAWWYAKPTVSRISPWEQGLEINKLPPSTTAKVHSFDAARESFEFDRPAVMVESSEADHREQFTWTRAIGLEFVERLGRWHEAGERPPIPQQRAAGAELDTPTGQLPVPPVEDERRQPS